MVGGAVVLGSGGETREIEDEIIVKWMDGRMDGWVNGWMDG